VNARQARDVERWAAQDLAAKGGHVCLLCGGPAHAELIGEHQPELVVWDLCDTCESAFHFLAVGLELLEDVDQAAAEQVAGQLELLEDEEPDPKYNSSGRRIR
jgi:hypothetical protein